MDKKAKGDLSSSMTASTSAIIEDFVASYEKHRDFYNHTAIAVRRICEAALERHHIPCLVSHRAKESASLRKKLYARQLLRGHDYSSREEIKNEISDLAGVRIALYYPRHGEEVKRILDDKFTVVEEKTISRMGIDEAIHGGYDRWFPGYCAKHYRVHLKNGTVNQEGVPIHNTKVEIQVVSALRHVWAEVEHDVVYKGKLRASRDDHRILDGLSGAVFLGECFLDQLYQTQIARTTTDDKGFESVYALGSFLWNWTASLGHCQVEYPVEVEFLKDLLDILGLNHPRTLRDILSQIDLSTREGSEWHSFRAAFHPARSSLTMFIMDRILTMPVGASKLENTPVDHPGLDHARHELGLISSSLIWLDRVYPLSSQLFGALFAGDSWDCYLPGIRWLDSRKAQDYWRGTAVLTDEEKYKIKALFQCFARNREKPIQLAFALARLGVLKRYTADWLALHRVISPLLIVIKARY
jgi:ppGpp synthetase/RelA/SpoT-type nucleotidyltranferase